MYGFETSCTSIIYIKIFLKVYILPNVLLDIVFHIPELFMYSEIQVTFSVTFLEPYLENTNIFSVLILLVKLLICFSSKVLA